MKSKNLRGRVNHFTLLLFSLLNAFKHTNTATISHALRHKSFLWYFFMFHLPLIRFSKIKFHHFIWSLLCCYTFLMGEKFWGQILSFCNFPPCPLVWRTNTGMSLKPYFQVFEDLSHFPLSPSSRQSIPIISNISCITVFADAHCIFALLPIGSSAHVDKDKIIFNLTMSSPSIMSGTE